MKPSNLRQRLAGIEAGLFAQSFAIGVLVYFAWSIWMRVNDIHGKIVVMPPIRVKEE